MIATSSQSSGFSITWCDEGHGGSIGGMGLREEPASVTGPEQASMTQINVMEVLVECIFKILLIKNSSSVNSFQRCLSAAMCSQVSGSVGSLHRLHMRQKPSTALGHLPSSVWVPGLALIQASSHTSRAIVIGLRRSCPRRGGMSPVAHIGFQMDRIPGPVVTGLSSHPCSPSPSDPVFTACL